MNRLILIGLILVTLAHCAGPANAQNPFTQQADPKKEMRDPSPIRPNKILYTITLWQQQLKQAISSQTRQIKQTGDWGPFFLLSFLAFLYGMLHAGGPGHGKAAALSYIVSRGKHYGSAILFGNLIAFCHGILGITLILVLHSILSRRISGTMESINRFTQMTSYGLITLIGAILFFSGIYSWYQRKKPSESCDSPSQNDKNNTAITMVVALGMVPCPGIILIMLFFLSMGFIKLGLVIALFQTLGMAVTMSCVMILGLYGKKTALAFFETRQTTLKTIETIIETTAAFFIMSIGLLFFTAALFSAHS